MGKTDQFFVYVLKNPFGKFYVGQTQNLEERLNRHNCGQSTYTKNRGPWELVYYEPVESRSAAMQREKEIKNKKSAKYIQWLIDSQNI